MVTIYSDKPFSKPYVFVYTRKVIRFSIQDEYKFYELYTEPVNKVNRETGETMTIVGYFIKLYKTKVKPHLSSIVKRSMMNRIQILLNDDFNESFSQLRKQGNLSLSIVRKTDNTSTYVIVGTRQVSPNSRRKGYKFCLTE